MVMGKNVLIVFLIVALSFVCVSSASSLPSSPSKIVTGLFSNAVPALIKWLRSLKPATRPATAGRSMMKFESGYSVETVFDGSKLGIEPYSIEVLPSGELLILDSDNSNIYRISASLSLYSRPRLVAGSPEGYFGHVDGKPQESKMNHPKGLTVDDRGNIYIADTMNMAIRKISDGGVTTIAGGRARGVMHADGPSEAAKFSNDFDVVYIGSSCSLLVIDRGNKAIREIQLHFDDCAYQYKSGFPLGVAVLIAAGFFGYMLALLQRRVGAMVSSQKEQNIFESSNTRSQYQKPMKSVRPPLIPTDGELEKQGEGFFSSLAKLAFSPTEAVSDILGGIFPGFRKKAPHSYQYQNYPQYHQQQKQSVGWSSQDSYEIPDDEPPSIETRTPTPRKTYPFMTEDAEKVQQQLRKNSARAIFNSWDSNLRQQQKQQQQQHGHYSSPVQKFAAEDAEKVQHQLRKNSGRAIYNGLDGELPQQQPQHHRHYSSPPQMFTVFGSIQEQVGRQESVAPDAADYKDPIQGRCNFRSRKRC